MNFSSITKSYRVPKLKGFDYREIINSIDELFKPALEYNGIGAKTSGGYGFMNEVKHGEKN